MKHGESIRTAPLDVADEEAAKATVQAAVAAFGRLDVVVNNAGYGDVAPFEQLRSDRFRAVIDTNFYGVVNVTRAALPTMRKQKSGYIFQTQRTSCSGVTPFNTLPRPTRPGQPMQNAGDRSASRLTRTRPKLLEVQ